MSRSFVLYVKGVTEIQWTPALFNKAPNLYVELTVDGITQRTRVIKRNLTPVWDETLTLSGQNTSSVINIFVKHESSKLFRKDPCIGRIDVEIDSLLRNCNNDRDVSLDIETAGNRTGVLTLKLELVDRQKPGLIAVNNASSDIKRVETSLTSTAAKVVEGMDRVADNDPSAFLNSLSGVLSKLDLFVTLVDKATKVHPYAKLAWEVVSSLYKVMKGQLERDSKLVGLVRTMEDTYAFVEASDSFQNKVHVLDDTIGRILKQTIECAIFIREYTGHGFAGRVVRQTFNSDGEKIEELSQAMISLKQSLDSSNILQAVFTSTRTLRGVETIVEMETLKLLNHTKMDASSRSECLAGTREEILKFITNWIITPSEKENVLWLHGLAGSGKSTISTTVSEYFRDMNRLGCFIFFDRNDPAHSDPNTIIRTMAYRLALFDARIRAAICAVIQSDGSVSEAPIRKQFSKLVLDPLQSIGSQAMDGPVVIVIDALDECGEPRSRRNLLALLAEELNKLPSTFRFIITSRAESDISAAFSNKPNIHEKELSISVQSNESDVYSFLCNGMVGIRKRHAIFELPSDWPGDMAVRDLLMRSAGLFIWASMAVNFISEGYDPREQLKVLLSAKSHRRPEAALDALYETALHAAGKWDSETFVTDFHAVMSAILASQILLSDEMIDKLLGSDGRTPAKFVLPLLRCLLQWNPGQPVRILHASFSDYLTDPRHYGKHPWIIDISIAHQVLAVSCLQRMNDGLHFNMCLLESSHVANQDVPDLSERISTAVPPYLFYACQFWANHLYIACRSDALLEKIDHFLFNNLLHWLEVLSLTGKVNLASPALLKTAKWSRMSGAEPDLVAFAIDASKLVATFKDPISKSAPHIYLTALPFAPLESKVSDHFQYRFPRLIFVQSGRADRWPPCLLRLDGHTDEVSSVTFSPDSTLIASGSLDQTIRVWDSETGDTVSGPFEGHSGSVTSVVFSSDCKRVFSGSEDGTIRIWDVLTGNGVLRPLVGHAGRVTCVAVSSDNRYIASGSDDATVRVWDARTGEVISEPLEGHTSINSISFLGSRIVSASGEDTVRFWSLDTGSSTSVTFDTAVSVAVSPDGKHIFTVGGTLTCEAWDAETGQPSSKPFQVNSTDVKVLAFSPDNKNIALPSYNSSSIQVLDAQSGHEVSKPFPGHTDYVSCLAYSPDAKLLVSGSPDHTVRVWDIERNMKSHQPANLDAFTCVAFSPTGERIVTRGPEDNTLRIWDVRTGQAVSKPFVGHTGTIMSVAFSPDGRRVASGSRDQTIRVWDTQTGHTISVSKRNVGDINSIAFSPDSKRVASSSNMEPGMKHDGDVAIFVWDVELGNDILGPLQRDTDETRLVSAHVISNASCVAFSLDGKFIVSGSTDNQAILWNADTGVAMRSFNAMRPVVSITISPDGKWVVTGSILGLMIWDLETGTIVSHSFDIVPPLFDAKSDRVDFEVDSVAFSPDSKRIVVGLQNSTIQILDVSTRTTILGPLHGHGAAVSCVAFSPDGGHIVSNSWDGTLRVWDLGTANEGSDEKGPNADSHLPKAYNIDSQPDGFTEKSRWEDGWILNSHSEPLFWVPIWNRNRLWWPRNAVVIGQECTKLDLSHFVHGTSWQQCKQRT